HGQVDGVLEQVVVFFTDAAQARQGVVVAQHRIDHAIGQLVEGVDINGAADFDIFQYVADQTPCFIVQFVRFAHFFLHAGAGLLVGLQFGGFLQPLLILAVNFYGRNRVGDIKPTGRVNVHFGNAAGADFINGGLIGDAALFLVIVMRNPVAVQVRYVHTGP